MNGRSWGGIATLAVVVGVGIGVGIGLANQPVDAGPIAGPPDATATAEVQPATTSNPPMTSTTTVETTTASTEPLPPPPSVAGKASGPVEVYETPRDPAPIRILPATTVLGTPTVVSVLDDTVDGWIEAMLPGRPNGATGWLRAEDLEIFTFDREVVIDLSDRVLTVITDGVANFQTEIAIGSDVSPTPTGTFFVTDAVELTRPRGPWGPFAFGLSARSDVVTEFAGGDGIIGIHGTNQPWSIGEAASLGCVRLPNDVMAILWEIVAVGVKVTISD